MFLKLLSIKAFVFLFVSQFLLVSSFSFITFITSPTSCTEAYTHSLIHLIPPYSHIYTNASYTHLHFTTYMHICNYINKTYTCATHIPTGLYIGTHLIHITGMYTKHPCILSTLWSWHLYRLKTQWSQSVLPKFLYLPGSLLNVLCMLSCFMFILKRWNQQFLIEQRRILRPEGG